MSRVIRFNKKEYEDKLDKMSYTEICEEWDSVVEVFKKYAFKKVKAKRSDLTTSSGRVL